GNRGPGPGPVGGIVRHAFHGGLSSCLDRLRFDRLRDLPRNRGITARRISMDYRWTIPDGRHHRVDRRVSVDPAEAGLSPPLSLPVALHAARLAPRVGRRAAYGICTRHLVRRLLRRTHGADVRTGHHEPALDGYSHR